MNADLSDAILMGANVTHVDVDGANLTTNLSVDRDVLEAGGVTGTPILSPPWVLVDGYLIGPGIRTNPPANLSDADLAGADLDGVVRSDTTCPDGTYGDNDDHSCDSNLTP